MNVNGVFRKKSGFTIVQNEIARSKKLSLRAKGLYLHIASYITYENLTLTKKFIQTNGIEGERAFDTAWLELKEAGYLKIYFINTKKGGWKTEYDLLETATEPEVHTFYCDKDGNILSTNLDRKMKKEKNVTVEDDIKTVTEDIEENKRNIELNTEQEEKISENHRTPKKGVTVKKENSAIERYPLFGSNANRSNGKGGNNNNTIYNTIYNTDNNIHPSLCHNKEKDGRMERNISLLERQIENIKTNIGYYDNFNSFDNAPNSLKNDFEEIIKIIADVMVTGSGKIKINGTEINIDIVKDKFKKLKFDDIDNLISIIKNKNDYEIKNYRAFVLTALYNNLNGDNLLLKHQLYFNERIKS